MIGGKGFRFLHPFPRLGLSFDRHQDVRSLVMAARVRLCTGASAVLAGALLAHSRSLQEPMEGPVKVLGRILQEPRADQAKASAVTSGC